MIPLESTSPTKFLIVNNGHSMNNGSMAMALAFIGNLRRRHPEAQVVVHLMGHNISQEQERWHKAGICTTTGVILRVPFRRFKLLPFVIAGSPLLFLLPKFIRKKIIGDFADAYVYISLAGEDLISDNCHWLQALALFTIFLLAFFQRKPFVVMAQTFGPFSRPVIKSIARFVYRRAALVTARGEDSRNNVKVLSGRTPHLVGDLAFLLEPVPFKTLRSSHDELRSLPDQYIGVSISRLFVSEIVRVNPTWQDIETFYSVFAKVLDSWGRKLNLPIVFTPHVIMPENDDRKAASIISESMQHDTIELTGAYHADEIKAVIARSWLFIGCRMHALIAALSSKVPTLALGYSPKMIEVIHNYIPYEYAVDVRSTSPESFRKDIDVMIDRISTEHDEIVTTLQQRINAMIIQSEKNFQLLDELVIDLRSKYET